MGSFLSSAVKVRGDVRNARRSVDDTDRPKCLVNLPTELLFKILSYLPAREKMMMRYVSRRLRDITETPLMWKDFVWPDYEPRHVHGVTKVLKAYGEHVRRIHFPAHVTPFKVLEMTGYCAKVTNLSLPKDTQLSLDDLEKIVHAMTHLQQLDVFISRFIQHNRYTAINGLLKIAAVGVRELELRTEEHNAGLVVSFIKVWADGKKPLPSVINILTPISSKKSGEKITVEMFLLWSASDSIPSLISFEIGLYDIKRIPMNLYPLMPIRTFHYGPAAKPPLIRLGKHGIVGLKDDVFYLNEYDHCGTIRHTITPSFSLKYVSLIKERHFNCSSNLHSVSYIDISDASVRSNHLEQIAVVCPNLQRLNLRDNVQCLKDLQGLRAIVHTCQNLEGLNLAGISVSSVESHLLLWKLLSTFEKLTHLAIDWCLLKSCDLDDATKRKLTGMLRSCHSLRALEIQRCMNFKKCCNMGCNDNEDFLFSHFPSLTHCILSKLHYSSLSYAVTNCHQLKYFYEDARKESLLLLSNNCRLQQLYIKLASFNLTDEMMNTLSAHGELECVVLYINSITINGITMLINNSPNLILLRIIVKVPLFIDGYSGESTIDYTDRVRKMCSYQKLFAVGAFEVRMISKHFSTALINDTTLFDTDLNSLWTSVNDREQFPSTIDTYR